MVIGFLSVIVPVYHDWERLQLCLDALGRQELKKDQFEIIVVNNDPDDVRPSFLKCPENCLMINEQKPGSYAARNAGVGVARGEILAFTDADCIPDDDWLLSIVSHFRAEEGILVGRVEMFSVLRAGKYNFAESYDYIFGINQDLYARKSVGATANLAVSRAVFYNVGQFDSSLFSGGDVDFCSRAKRKGIGFKYSDSTRVFHPLRFSISELTIKAKRLASGKVKSNRVKGLLIAISPPVIRLKILFFDKKAPANVKIKAFFLIFYLKFHQVISAVKTFFGDYGERR
ncbi:glycosyltransferase family 2 protein [Marinobacter sp. F3R11]|uniref:glycosyltransferase family 2 protein n=1 Tax=Marinobacter sp. F3R11 TaxID=2267231 RepID=UPI000DE8627A|nr:glycosyltransferase [Marinobacter sp. F3R11]RBW48260.1 glycosyl transferase [Marinobacter sp. F3R11]